MTPTISVIASVIDDGPYCIMLLKYVVVNRTCNETSNSSPASVQYYSYNVDMMLCFKTFI